MAGTRPQVACAYTIADCLSDRAPNDVMLGPHLHSIASEDLTDMISDNHAVVIQTRPLLDTIVSMFDHFNRNPISFHAVTAHIAWHGLSESEKVDYLIYHYVPWHLQFLQSWDMEFYSRRVKRITYAEVVNDPIRVTQDILDLQGLKAGPVEELAQKDINFNVGRAGRGREKLSEEQLRRIANIADAVGKGWYKSPCTPGGELLI